MGGFERRGRTLAQDEGELPVETPDLAQQQGGVDPSPQVVMSDPYNQPRREVPVETVNDWLQV